MLVKKKLESWFPSENNNLKIGETIEITDARDLIMSGKVTAIGSNGEDVSAYELYGVVIADELEEFQNFMKMKKQEAIKTVLEKESTELKAQLAEVKTETPEPVTEEIKAPAEAPLYVAKKDR